MITLAIVALFIAGTAYFALQEVRAGRNTLDTVGAMEAAEYAAAAVPRDWDRAYNVTLPVGAALGGFSYPLTSATSTARITRATATTFWATTVGVAGRGSIRAGARRGVAVLYRLLIAEPGVRAALAARDSVEVRDGGVIAGTDSVLGGTPVIPSCRDAVAPAVAGTVTPDTSRVCDGSCGAPAGNIRGLPPRLNDPGADDSARYVLFGEQTWQSLSAMADIVLPPNATVTPLPLVTGGACQRGPITNWGDPAGTTACASYLPIILARGDVTVSGGVGQGILLSEGDIRLGAGTTFVGLAVARDDIVTLGGGATILGAATARDARPGPADHTIVNAGGLIRYSACGLSRALFGAALLQRIRQRAWMELF
jgi:hypothetical protein